MKRGVVQYCQDRAAARWKVAQVEKQDESRAEKEERGRVSAGQRQGSAKRWWKQWRQGGRRELKVQHCRDRAAARWKVAQVEKQ